LAGAQIFRGQNSLAPDSLFDSNTSVFGRLDALESRAHMGSWHPGRVAGPD
jgi:hypothetical protein